MSRRQDLVFFDGRSRFLAVRRERRFRPAVKREVRGAQDSGKFALRVHGRLTKYRAYTHEMNLSKRPRTGKAPSAHVAKFFTGNYLQEPDPNDGGEFLKKR